jgi:hypothetical protein
MPTGAAEPKEEKYTIHIYCFIRLFTTVHPNFVALVVTVVAPSPLILVIIKDISSYYTVYI